MDAQSATTEQEKVVIYGIDRHRIGVDGEGVTTLVALRQCPLHCRYCINDDCHTLPDEPLRLTAGDVVERCRIDNLYFLYTNGGICVGGGEPLLHPRFIHELREQMPEEWRLTLETSLCVPLVNIQQIADDVAMWVIDVKDMNPAIYRAYTDCSNERVVENLHFLADRGLQPRCTLRLPLIPDFNTDADRDASEATLRLMGFTEFDRFDYVVRGERKA